MVKTAALLVVLSTALLVSTGLGAQQKRRRLLSDNDYSATPRDSNARTPPPTTDERDDTLTIVNDEIGPTFAASATAGSVMADEDAIAATLAMGGFAKASDIARDAKVLVVSDRESLLSLVKDAIRSARAQTHAANDDNTDWTTYVESHTVPYSVRLATVNDTIAHLRAAADDPAETTEERAIALADARGRLYNHSTLRLGISEMPLTDAVRRVLLGDETWIEVEIMEEYMAMLHERSVQNGHSEFFAKTSFTSRLHTGQIVQDYLVSRIFLESPVDDIRRYDRVFLPINVGNVHWLLVVVDLSTKTIAHFDSTMPGMSETLKANGGVTDKTLTAAKEASKPLLERVHAWVRGELQLASAIDASLRVDHSNSRDARSDLWLQTRAELHDAITRIVEPTNATNFTLYHADDQTFDVTSEEVFPAWSCGSGDMTGWRIGILRNAPQQDNGNDCGVHVARNIDYISQGVPLLLDGPRCAEHYRASMYDAVIVGRLGGDLRRSRPIHRQP